MQEWRAGFDPALSRPQRLADCLPLFPARFVQAACRCRRSPAAADAAGPQAGERSGIDAADGGGRFKVPVEEVAR